VCSSNKLMLQSSDYKPVHINLMFTILHIKHRSYRSVHINHVQIHVFIISHNKVRRFVLPWWVAYIVLAKDFLYTSFTLSLLCFHTLPFYCFTYVNGNLLSQFIIGAARSMIFISNISWISHSNMGKKNLSSTDPHEHMFFVYPLFLFLQFDLFMIRPTRQHKNKDKFCYYQLLNMLCFVNDNAR
jgi:hypothetical protein